VNEYYKDDGGTIGEFGQLIEFLMIEKYKNDTNRLLR
jgi:hypothetical protein